MPADPELDGLEGVVVDGLDVDGLDVDGFVVVVCPEL